MRLAVASSHPIQYHSPFFCELAKRLDLMGFYAHRATPTDQGDAGFDVPFEWDTDLFSGYAYEFLWNVSGRPSLDRFDGCDTPEISERLRLGRFDALLVPGWHRKSFLQAIVGAKRLGLATLVRGDSHLGTPRSWAKRAAKGIVYPPFLRVFSAALYVGKQSYEDWTHYGFPKARLFSSPHCVDTERFARSATPEARIQIRGQLAIRPDARVVLFAGKSLP